MTDLRKLIAQNIKKYRKIQGLSQEMLAEKAGTSTTHIGMVEIGKKFPSVRMFEKIAAALGIDTPELFNTGTVIFMPTHGKSIDLLYHNIIDELHDFEKSVNKKFKDLQKNPE